MVSSKPPDDRGASRVVVLYTITRVLSVFLLFAFPFLIILAITTLLTLSGILYLVSLVLIIIGISGFAWGYVRFRYLFWVGIGLLLTVAAVRVILPRGDKIKLLILPDQHTACPINCLIDEQDAATISTRILPYMGMSATEQAGLMDAMVARYSEMTAVQSLVPSPLLRTYLNLQRPDAFDAVIVEPDSDQPPQMGLIFLHGFTGNFTMPCWLMAQSASAFHALTICPSVGWKGDWWTADGEATLRTTIIYLQQHGISRIVLAGLSNGAVGASELAYKLNDEFAGLILISGASLDAQDSGLPVLVLTGTQDERMPVEMMQAYVNQIGSRATFVSLEADHFMLVKQFAEVHAQIDVWLRQNIFKKHFG